MYEQNNRLIGNKNEIMNVERMKEIVIDAVGLSRRYYKQYALWKEIPQYEAKLYVDMYFDKALKEYNKTYVV